MKDLERRRVRALHELPQALEPPRDLWPQIEMQLRAGAPVRSARTSGARGLSSWRWAAAAAIALLAAALGAGLWWLPGRVTRGGPVHGTGVAAQVDRGSHGATPVIAEDDAARREALLRSLNERLRGLPAPTQQQVRADLQVIERSIQDIQSALGREPGNALLHEMLRETEQDEQHLAATVRDAGVWTEEASGGQGRAGS
jgi:hypothetical protein